MKKFCFLLFLMATFACNSPSNKATKSSSDTTIADSASMDFDQSMSKNLIELNKEILTALKKQDYQILASHIHPTLGLRLSPYATISINNDVVFKSTELQKKMKENTKLFWGNYDGTGDPIDLSAKDYFAEFVYDVDFLNAEKITINRSLTKGNSINNIPSIYPESVYVENYFSGFNKKYEGMDWRALRLVFQKEGIDKYYLIGIVHDQWTI